MNLFAGARSIENAAQTLQRLRRDYPEVFTNCEDYKFEGRRQRTTPVGDISMVVETILLVPGKQAASVRSECAKLFVRVYGGDLALTEQIINNRKWQDELSRTSPQHPARVFGAEVEATSEVVSTEVATKTCEIAIRSLLPAMLEQISAIFVNNFKEFRHREFVRRRSFDRKCRPDIATTEARLP